MTERQPTEHEWRLVAKKMGWECVEYIDFVANDQRGKCVIIENHFLMIRGGRNFRPLHDHNDLARLVEAMQAAGYFITRAIYPDFMHTSTPYSCIIDVSRREKEPYRKAQLAYVWRPTDIEATFWACVEALVAEEERDEQR